MLFSNYDSVIAIHNHWVSLKKNLFGTSNLSEVWNPNLSFMWVPWKIWEQLINCFWIQRGFKFGLSFMWVPILLPLLGPLIICLLPIWNHSSIPRSPSSRPRSWNLRECWTWSPPMSPTFSTLLSTEKLDNLNRVAAVVSRLGKKCSEPALQGFEHVYVGPSFLSLKIIPDTSLSLFLSAITENYSRCFCISQITYTKPL